MEFSAFSRSTGFWLASRFRISTVCGRSRAPRNSFAWVTIALFLIAGCAGQGARDKCISDGEKSCCIGESANASLQVDSNTLLRLAAGAAGGDPTLIPAPSPGGRQAPHIPPSPPVLTGPGEMVFLHDGKCTGAIWSESAGQ